MGYSSAEETDDSQFGSVRRIDSKTLMQLGMLGSDMNMTILTKTWQNGQNRPTRMEFTVESAGRSQVSTATFGKDTIDLESNNNGAVSKRSVPLPKDAPVVDDPMNAFLEGATGKTFYVLDPMTLALVKNEVIDKGSVTVIIKSQTFKAHKLLIREPRSDSSVYLSAKGDVIKIEGAMGIEMYPSTEKEALAPLTERTRASDLGFSTAISLQGAPQGLNSFKTVVLGITGPDLSRLPSGPGQVVTKPTKSKEWTLKISPLTINRTTPAKIAASQKPTWLTKSQNIDPTESSILAASKSAAEGETTVAGITEKIRAFVSNAMTPNAGIGVLRDAKEILETKEGVCRDYATLTAALLRASGIPTRVASGLILEDEKYYYHAWVEVWDGFHWIGVDSTRNVYVGAGYIKLAQGQIEDAFTFTVLEAAKIRVISAIR